MKTKIVLSAKELQDSDFKRFAIEIGLDDECKNGHNDFAITATAWYKDCGQIGGCCHEKILELRPDLKPFIDLHLCRETGEPSFAVENGFYYYELMQKDSVDGDYTKYFKILKNHLRITENELLDLIISIMDKKINGSHIDEIKKNQKLVFSDFVETLKPRWKAEADQAKDLLISLIGDNDKPIISEYEIHAQDFLNTTNTEISIKFLKNGKHFPKDKENRDIYNVELKRGSRSYTFKFGQSLNDSGFKVKLKSGLVKDIQIPDGKVQEYLKNPNILKNEVVRLLGFSLMNGEKIIKPKVPTVYDILACLQKYDVGSFEDFCSEFGYDEDSKTAEKTYNAVVEEYQGLCILYSDQELELMQEIN